MSLRRFIDRTDVPDCTMAVVGEETDGVLEGMLAETFGDRGVTVTADPATATDEGAVLLLEDGRVVASSALSELYDAILAINSDLFITGARGLEEVELPDVLAGLDEFRFTLRGYPLAHKEKLLLIVVSRYIERLAWEASGGVLRSSFQRLSRLDDEIGTREVYEQLSATAVDVHVYGVPDRIPDLDVVVHGGDGEEYRRSWFVVFRPDDPADEGAALVALETEPRVWDAFWTYDEGLVERIEAYVAREL